MSNWQSVTADLHCLIPDRIICVSNKRNVAHKEESMKPIGYAVRRLDGRLVALCSTEPEAKRSRVFTTDTVMPLFERPASPVTDWFPPEVKPVHVGWYMTEVSNRGLLPLYWDGKLWRQDDCVTYHLGCQNRPWYGLTSEVK